MTSPKSEDFHKQIDEIFTFAESKMLNAVISTAGNLHRVVGKYPGSDHRMHVCSNVMKKNMILDDQILCSPPKGVGSSLRIQYIFPRSRKN